MRKLKKFRNLSVFFFVSIVWSLSSSFFTAHFKHNNKIYTSVFIFIYFLSHCVWCFSFFWNLSLYDAFMSIILCWQIIHSFSVFLFLCVYQIYSVFFFLFYAFKATSLKWCVCVCVHVCFCWKHDPNHFFWLPKYHHHNHQIIIINTVFFQYSQYCAQLIKIKFHRYHQHHHDDRFSCLLYAYWWNLNK